MPKDIRMDPSTHDILITNGRIELIQTEEDSTRQRLKIALLLFKGEWFRNINAGVPYLKNDNNPIQLLGKSTKALLDLELQKVISQTHGVVRIVDYSSSEDKITRKVNVSFSVQTLSGEVVSINDITI